MPADQRKSVRAVRLGARAPRAAVMATCAVLALAGVRTILSGPAAAPLAMAAVPAVAGPDVGAFAEAFARTYLSYGGSDPAARERSLQRFIGGDLEPDAGLQPPADGEQRVTWTAAGAARPAGPRRWLVTVAAAAGEEVRYLSVPVARSAGGGLVVDDYPALVGAPPRGTRSTLPNEAELRDQALADVAARALDNYLRGARENLRADLAPGASVTTPGPPLRLDAVEALAWRAPGRLLAVTVTATDGAGARMRLRFLLSVERRDRWYLRAVNDPTTTTTTEGPTQ